MYVQKMKRLNIFFCLETWPCLNRFGGMVKEITFCVELQDALELALEGAFVVEILAIDDLDRPQRPGHAPRHPDLAIGAATDLAENIVIRNARITSVRGGHFSGNVEHGTSNMERRIGNSCLSRLFLEFWMTCER